MRNGLHFARWYTVLRSSIEFHGFIDECGDRHSGIWYVHKLTSNAFQPSILFLDRSSGPFIARFVSNERFVGRGFQIGFQQNPCGSRLPSPDSLLNQG